MPSRTVSARLALPALITVSLLALAGCSGGDSKKSSEPEEGPLTKYMSALYGSQEQDQEFYDKINEKREELIAECMADEGFEYQPNTQNGGMASFDDEEIDWGSREYAEQYGYGFTDFPGRAEMEAEGEGEEYVDPNQDYIESLSESEQQAFYEALSGPQPTEEDMAAMEDDTFEWDWSKMGCSGVADHETQEMYGPGMAAMEDPEFAELFESMEAVWAGIYNYEDPAATSPNDDVAKLDREWSECMADAGYTDLTNPMHAQNVFMEESNSLYELPEGEDPEKWEGPSEKQMSEIKKREIEMAVTDWECKDKLGYDDKVQQITFDLEQKFVDEHKAELDALIAKYSVDEKK